MSWATTFNPNSAAANRLSNKMENIKLDTEVSQADIQARIKKHENDFKTRQDVSNQTQGANSVSYPMNSAGGSNYSNPPQTTNQAVYRQGMTISQNPAPAPGTSYTESTPSTLNTGCSAAGSTQNNVSMSADYSAAGGVPLTSNTAGYSALQTNPIYSSYYACPSCSYETQPQQPGQYQNYQAYTMPQYQYASPAAPAYANYNAPAMQSGQNFDSNKILDNAQAEQL